MPHLSEHAALGRIEVARTARRLPVILDLLLDGSVTVTSAPLLAPYLTEENHRDVLRSDQHHRASERVLPDGELVVMPEENIYIRSEDMSLITADGARILSDWLPRDISAIEKAMAEPGLLQKYPLLKFDKQSQ